MILLVEDEPLVRRAIRRVLVAADLQVASASSVDEALALLQDGSFAAVVSDIGLPGGTGLDVLRFARQRDETLPVIMVTGAPTVATAAKAVEHGAFRYLLKPVEPALLVDTVRLAIRRSQELRDRDGRQLHGPEDMDLDSAMNLLWMAYQPIVEARTGTRLGHEALVRSDHPRLSRPGALLSAAESARRVRELGRRIRARVATDLEVSRYPETLFVNLHPRDLEDPALLAADWTSRPTQVVLEVTERSALEHVSDLSRAAARLRELGFRIAIDDLGAGYAGLSSFVHLQPDVVKLDMSLTRAIGGSSLKRKLVTSLVELCRDVGIRTVAEGVETESERDELVAIGCDYLQGNLFGLPLRRGIEAQGS